jgi:leader peptidase (prepilin peptidase) / N-methyltransferase
VNFSPPGGDPIWPIVLFAGTFGLLLGSFLNVCITRWPSELSVVRPRSRCPRCEMMIAWYDNIPVLSWLLLRAKCRKCALPIPVMYPLVELAVGLIWAAAVAWYGLEIEAVRAATFATLLLGIAMTDAREYIIPDEFSIGGTVIGLLFAFAGGALGWQDAILGAVVGYALLWVIAVVGTKAFGEDAMGGGDIKMMAMLGAFLGWQGVLLTLFLGALIGTLIFLPMKLAGKEKLVPFGIFLAIGGAAYWVVGEAMVMWYRVSVLGL